MLDTKLFNTKTRLEAFQAKVWRVVESQERIATLGLVDSMPEQEMLESLLDNVKPPYRTGTESMHYLIKTAFRYPPLKYGSRFGKRTMQSFFYASLLIDTALIETAYYRFLFMQDMDSSYSRHVDSEHTAFSVSVRTNNCLNLRNKKYAKVRKRLIHSSDYSYTQALGKWAVEERKIDMIQFESARHPEHFNLAIAEPDSIRSRKPLNYEKWLCRTTTDRVSFSSRERPRPLIILKNDLFKT